MLHFLKMLHKHIKMLHTNKKVTFGIFKKRNTVGEAPTVFFFEIIKTQIRVHGDLNLGGWVIRPLS
jgi:hypothetical protein